MPPNEPHTITWSPHAKPVLRKYNVTVRFTHKTGKLARTRPAIGDLFAHDVTMEGLYVTQQLFDSVPGVEAVRVEPFAVWVQIGGAFTWDTAHDQVIAALKAKAFRADAQVTVTGPVPLQ